MSHYLEEIWPEWSIVETLGKGSYGTVYKIERKVNGRSEYQALKVVNIPSNTSEVNNLYDAGMDQKSVEQYYRKAVDFLVKEIEIMESLRDVYSVVRIEGSAIRKQDAGIGWSVYIRMELLMNLNDYASKHTMTRSEIMHMGIDIARALVYCEQRHIIHRDIKPANILVSEEGIYKLSDFGIARRMEATTGASTVAGTENYMAPEIAKGEKYNHTVDTYSLGLVLYQLLNHGRMPFLPPYPQPLSPDDVVKARYMRLKGEVPSAPLNAGEALSAIVLKAFAYQQEDRYQHAEELAADLEKLSQQWEKRTRLQELEEKIEAAQKQGDPAVMAELLEEYILLTNENRLYKELCGYYKEAGALQRALSAINQYLDYLEDNQVSSKQIAEAEDIKNELQTKIRERDRQKDDAVITLQKEIAVFNPEYDSTRALYRLKARYDNLTDDQKERITNYDKLDRLLRQAWEKARLEEERSRRSQRLNSEAAKITIGICAFAVLLSFSMMIMFRGRKHGSSTTSSTTTSQQTSSASERSSTSTTYENRYDSQNRLVKEYIYEGSRCTGYYYYSYTDEGKLRLKGMHDLDGHTLRSEGYKDGKLDYVITYAYDSRGNCIETRYLDGSNNLKTRTVMTYNENNKRMRSQTYRANGNLQSTVDYNDNGRIQTMKLYDTSGHLLSTSYFKYNSEGKQASQERYDANNVLTYRTTCDSQGRTVKAEYFKSGDLSYYYEYSYDASGKKTTKRYDASGNLLTTY